MIYDISEIVLKKNNFVKYNPVQKKCVEKGFEKNLIVSSPTASGKTIIAELFLLNQVLNKKKKVIYTCPLRALASEHYNDFKKKYPEIKFALSTGDLDSNSSYLKKFDVILTTYEKCLPPNEFIICKIKNELKIIKIEELFNLIKTKCKLIKLNDREVLEPTIKIETIGFKNNKPIFTPIKSLLKIKNKTQIINLKLESGREFSCTEDHKIYTQQEGKIQQTLAKNSLNKYSIALNQLKIFSNKTKELNLTKIFKKNPKKIEVLFSKIDITELTQLLTTKTRTRRRAKDLAKRYIKTRRISFDLALKSKTIKIDYFTGQRTDSQHKCKTKVKLDYNFGKFLGYFISEGCFNQAKKRETILQIPGFNPWIQKDVSTCLNKLKLPYSFSKKSKIFGINSMPYYLLLKSFGLSKRTKKNLPDFVFFTSKKFAQGILEGLFNGDGGPNPQSIDYSTMNKKLAYQIQILLLKYGITTYVYPQKVKNYPNTYYRLNIMGGQNIKEFNKLVSNLRPKLKNKIDYLISQTKKRQNLLHKIQPKCFLDKKFKIKVRDKCDQSVYMANYRNLRTSKENMQQFISKNRLNKLKTLMNTTTGNLKIKKITNCPPQEYVFNLQTNTDNYFLANSILIKNCASLQRHKADWLNNIGCLIVDEIHELDSDRGPTLEIAITQLRNQKKDLLVLGLSATISNARELSEWLQAELIESDYRPTKLLEGISLEKIIEYNNNSFEENSVEEIVEKNILEKQFLFFLNSRKRAEGQAKKITKEIEKNFNTKQKEKLEKIGNDILEVLEQPTEQCVALSTCVKQGIAFHHAGLLQKQRELVEKNFRSGLIRIICSTTTLSAGLNLPADFVIIPSLYRYSLRGMELIPNREYTQCVGRSGRPKFSSEGKSIILANNDSQKELFLEKYINGEIEPIYSKLGSESILRMHILGLIATNDLFDDKSVWNFFEKTLYVKQNNTIFEIYEKILKIIDELIEWGFVKKEKRYFTCTVLGKRVSDLFLDPKSAFELITALKSEKKFSELSYLFAWANCTEFFPTLNVPKKINNIIFEEFNNRLEELPFSEEKLFFEKNFLNVFFSATVLEKWINEYSEQKIFEEFGLAPGTLFGKTKIIEWLSYSTIELAKVLSLEKHFLKTKKIGLRTKYGVREELLPLVELKGIGRVRARKLFNNNIKTINNIKTNFSRVENILGKTVSNNLKKQLKI